MFVPERYDPAKAPRLYQPARDQQRERRARSGDRRRRCRTSSSAASCPAPAIATTAWSATPIRTTRRDSATTRASSPSRGSASPGTSTGDGKTALHASVGLYHNPHVNANGMDAMARNPPAQNTPSIFYGTMDTLLAAGAQGAFSNRPSDVFGIERDAKTPKSYNYSVGVQRELGWGTVIDVTYAGFQMRNGEMSTNINTVPDGARFLDVHPQNAESAEPDDRRSRTSSCGRIRATRTSRSGRTSARATTTRCRCSSIAATSTGLQFAVAYTLAQDRQRRRQCRAAGLRSRSSGGRLERRADESTQLHNLVVNYTWDVPNGSRMWDNSFTRGALDGWQVSGDTAVVSGDWSGATTSTTDNFDFTGGDGGTRPRISGDVLCASDNCDPTPGGPGSYFNVVGLQPTDGPRRLSATRRAASSGCRRSSIRTCPSSRTSRWAAAGGSSSAGRCTTCSTR